MSPQREMDMLLRFLRAVERGKELHPGPYNKEQWKRDAERENEEVRQENCYVCLTCERSESSAVCINNLKRYAQEVLDSAVVRYREWGYLMGLIADKESALAGE